MNFPLNKCDLKAVPVNIGSGLFRTCLIFNILIRLAYGFLKTKIVKIFIKPTFEVPEKKHEIDRKKGEMKIFLLSVAKIPLEDPPQPPPYCYRKVVSESQTGPCMKSNR
jgi:hypothetical protein